MASLLFDYSVVEPPTAILLTAYFVIAFIVLLILSFIKPLMRIDDSVRDVILYGRNITGGLAGLGLLVILNPWGGKDSSIVSEYREDFDTEKKKRRESGNNEEILNQAYAAQRLGKLNINANKVEKNVNAASKVSELTSRFNKPQTPMPAVQVAQLQTPALAPPQSGTVGEKQQ